jgi:hypothetical protein
MATLVCFVRLAQWNVPAQFTVGNTLTPRLENLTIVQGPASVKVGSFPPVSAR